MMLNKFYLAFLTLTFAIFVSTNLPAQKPARTVKPVTTDAANKKPLVKSSLGKVNGNITLEAAAAGDLITQALKVTDDKNVEYAISSYQFAYKRIGVTEDEETGKTSPQSDVTADRFTATPLPPVWQKNIIDGLHSGEELYFFDIIVFDKKGRRFFAPELKITVQ